MIAFLSGFLIGVATYYIAYRHGFNNGEKHGYLLRRIKDGNKVAVVKDKNES